MDIADIMTNGCVDTNELTDTEDEVETRMQRVN